MSGRPPLAWLIAVACIAPVLVCDPSQAADASPVQIQAASLPAPDARTSGAALESDYHIGPLDQLDITVFQVEELTRTVEVGSSGQIALPLIGQVTATGKTPQELQTEIADKLSHFVRAPQVTVSVKLAQSQKITVEGSVVQPGVYPLAGRTTLVQALALAHGVDTYAKLHQIVVFRTIKGQRMAAAFDLDGIRKGKYPDPEVFGNDIIEVEQNGAKKTLYEFVQLAPLFNFLPRP